MNTMLRPILELTVMISGILLAYLPVQTYLKQEPWKLAAWLAPLLTGTCILEGALCYFLNISTGLVLFLTLPVLMVIYHKTLLRGILSSESLHKSFLLNVFSILFLIYQSLSQIHPPVSA